MSCHACQPPPYMQQQQLQPQMSPDAMRHQHVVNHLASREAACPQGIDPHNVAVWGARRDNMERVNVCQNAEAPKQLEMQPMQQAQCCMPPPPQQQGGCCCANRGAMGVGTGFATLNTQQQGRTVSFIDWGGRWSASPEYDAKGSPHGFYGPPAVAAMLQQAGNGRNVGPVGAGGPMAMQQQQQPHGCGNCAPQGNACGGGGGYGVPNHYGNAYPGPQVGRNNKPDTTHDEYYQRREQEVRSGAFVPASKPQGTKAFFPETPTEPGRYTVRPAGPNERPTSPQGRTKAPTGSGGRSNSRQKQSGQRQSSKPIGFGG